MSLMRAMSVSLAHARQRATRAALRTLICARHPTLACDSTVIWDIPYRALDELELGVAVRVMPFCEILVIPHSRFSSTPGRLVLGNDAVIATGVNLRAAGGEIRIGTGSAIGQHSVVVAANHQVVLGEPYFSTPWDETKTGVELGRNVCVGANCVLLPGTRIGDNSLIAAGSVVNSEVPPGEIWGGVPARRLKAVPSRAELDSSGVPVSPR
jgi:acetyltransferase-like isoleucine patch superfamily enzyme